MTGCVVGRFAGPFSCAAIGLCGGLVLSLATAADIESAVLRKNRLDERRFVDVGSAEAVAGRSATVVLPPLMRFQVLGIATAQVQELQCRWSGQQHCRQ
jgi:hypothetical protein